MALRRKVLPPNTAVARVPVVSRNVPQRTVPQRTDKIRMAATIAYILDCAHTKLYTDDIGSQICSKIKDCCTTTKPGAWREIATQCMPVIMYCENAIRGFINDKSIILRAKKENVDVRAKKESVPPDVFWDGCYESITRNGALVKCDASRAHTYADAIYTENYRPVNNPKYDNISAYLTKRKNIRESPAIIKYAGAILSQLKTLRAKCATGYRGGDIADCQQSIRYSYTWITNTWQYVRRVYGYNQGCLCDIVTINRAINDMGAEYITQMYAAKLYPPAPQLQSSKEVVRYPPKN